MIRHISTLLLAATSFQPTPDVAIDKPAPTNEARHIADLATPLPAITRPGRRALISAPISETIASINAEEGQHVEAGQLLIKLDDQIAIAQLHSAQARAAAMGAYEQARANLRFTETNEAMMREARRTGAAGEMELLRATADREQAAASLREATEQRDLARLEAIELRARHERHIIRAPFKGTVARIHAQLGETPKSSDPLIELIDLSTLKVDIQLPADALADLHPGDSHTLYALAPVNRPVRATLDAVIPTIDPAARTVRCIFTIDNPDLALPAGFHVTLDRPMPVANAAP